MSKMLELVKNKNAHILLVRLKSMQKLALSSKVKHISTM